MLLNPGDLLLYAGTGLWAAAIRVKTWSDYSHVETYIGEGRTAGSRERVGVDTFTLMPDRLRLVLRPRRPFRLAAALAWHHTVLGQGYDYVGLMNFYIAAFRGQENGRMFCSEHATRFARHGGIEPFTRQTDADCIAPGELAKSAAYEVVYRV
jgi:hypothetical protein